MVITLKGRAAVKGKAEGEALVTRKPISYMGGVNLATGVCFQPRHDWLGKSISGKILVYPHGKGSSGDAMRIWTLAKNNKAPAAIINNRADPITVQGAILANIPMVYNLDKNPLEIIKNGDHVKVDGNKVIIEAKKKPE
jgi:hypothetical protein